VGHVEFGLKAWGDARLLRDQTGPHCEAILLGSVATPKYIDPLLGIFGERLMFPAEFVGRGDVNAK
jgi:hypothetical protein